MSGSAFHLDEQLAALERTPAVVAALLRGTSPDWHEINEGPGSWTAREVVGHLVHAEETNWTLRARTILEGGDSGRFEPFDRFAHLNRFSGWPLDDLLDRFASRRDESIRAVRGWKLDVETLSRRGTHLDLGAVTLRQLLATWVVHDFTHLAQIARVMARRNAVEVGPWREYLSILRT